MFFFFLNNEKNIFQTTFKFKSQTNSQTAHAYNDKYSHWQQIRNHLLEQTYILPKIYFLICFYFVLFKNGF
uniref:Uncharacterized protein n=1 Tax=Triatoma infestans TaxID=30076 RepID=A0A170XVS4_TRIIF